MKLKQLLNAIEFTGSVPDMDICDLVYDSRKCVPGCAFICLRGAASDGHKFAASAVEKGASVVIAEENLELGVPVIVTPNTRKALALLSAEFFGHPADKLTTIGITGTKGKTTTAFMLKYILDAAGFKTGVIGTIGFLSGDRLTATGNTTPESYQVQKFLSEMVDDGCKYCIMEVSSIGLREHRVDGFEFDVGIFTNFSEDHIGGVEHADMEEYLSCKAMLFKKCKNGIINIDDKVHDSILEGSSCRVLFYGFGSQADIRGENSHLCSEPGFIGSVLDVKGSIELTCHIGIPGKFNAYNALAALSCCHVLGIDSKYIKEGLRNVKVKGRVESLNVPGNYTLLIDYAHNAVSMENILSTLREYNPTRLICLFGAGGNRPKVRRYEMGEASGRLADLSVITEDNSRFEDVNDIIDDILIGMKKTEGKYVIIPHRRDAIRYCIENAQDGDIIVLAGKGHEDYQETKGVKSHFDEREVVAEILNSLGK